MVLVNLFGTYLKFNYNFKKSQIRLCRIHTTTSNDVVRVTWDD